MEIKSFLPYKQNKGVSERKSIERQNQEKKEARIIDRRFFSFKVVKCFSHTENARLYLLERVNIKALIENPLLIFGFSKQENFDLSRMYAAKYMKTPLNDLMYEENYEKLQKMLVDADLSDEGSLTHGILESYFSELRCMKKLSNCSRIVKLYDWAASWDAENEAIETILVMKYMKMNLQEYLSEIESLKMLCDIFIQCIDAVLQCHKKGILHLDLKMENFFCDEEGKVFLGDFGSAIIRQKNVKTWYGKMSTKVTQEFAAPEVINQGRLTPKADVYSLGLMFTKMIEYFSENHEKENSIISELLDIIDGMRQCDYSERNGNLTDIREEIDNILNIL